MASTARRKRDVPVTILTGFLGSGKTTLMNHILNDATHGMKFAVIENEFGQVGVDEKILSENVNEELVEVMNGCICCTVRGDLVVALKKLYDRVIEFDGVIIETTGLADPAPICQTFFIDDDIREMYHLDSVITVTDAKYILERLAEEKPEGVENEAVEQVAFADKILINKIDLADEAELVRIEKELRSINPTAIFQRTEQSKINPKDVLNLRAFDLQRVLDFDPEFLADTEHEHDSNVTSVSVKCEEPVNTNMLKNWIKRLIRVDGANLYRYKGLINVKDGDEKYVFQGVGMLFTGGFKGRWGKDEKRESRFVFIGKNLDPDLYRGGFLGCKEDGNLRFKVGTKVIANTGEWQRGTIVGQWEEGFAYSIQIDNDEKSVVYAPVDVDNYVKAIEGIDNSSPSKGKLSPKKTTRNPPAKATSRR